MNSIDADGFIAFRIIRFHQSRTWVSPSVLGAMCQNMSSRPQVASMSTIHPSHSSQVASPQGQSSVRSSFTSPPQRMSARVRSG